METHMLADSVSKAHQLAPEGMGATAQGLLEGVHWKLGMCTGSLVGGLLYEHVGAVRTFVIAAAVSAFALVLLAAAPVVARWLGWDVSSEHDRRLHMDDASKTRQVELSNVGGDGDAGEAEAIPLVQQEAECLDDECFDI
jgi:hypothetical protein